MQLFSSLPSTLLSDRKALRQHMRKQRRLLSRSQQLFAARQLARQSLHILRGSRCKKLALYWPNDGEIDPRLIARLAWQKNIAVYLPVLHPWQARRLWFVPFTPHTRFGKNRFGIAEPTAKRGMISARQLDIVLMPLVAFDDEGGRLGMGGGFYDCTLAYKHHIPGASRPRLLGVAHSFQQVEKLTLAPWDVALNAIITERGIIYPKKN
ncbi:MAG TPA: 5-formyltetrahydrofolate cyclo-ligase [Cellvibrionaceae bacterium]